MRRLKRRATAAAAAAEPRRTEPPAAKAAAAPPALPPAELRARVVEVPKDAPLEPEVEALREALRNGEAVMLAVDVEWSEPVAPVALVQVAVRRPGRPDVVYVVDALAEKTHAPLRSLSDPSEDAALIKISWSSAIGCVEADYYI